MLGTVNATTVNATNISGATAHGQLLIGNNTSGNFERSTLTQGAGITLTNAAGAITVAANATGTNTGDQNIHQNIIVAGRRPSSPTQRPGNLTFVAGDNVTITTNNITKAITFNATGGGGGGNLSTGIGTLWPTASIASPPGTGFFAAGDYGTAANTALGDWSIIEASGGTVAYSTVDVAAGAVPTGTVVTFSSATPSLTNFRSTTNGNLPPPTRLARPETRSRFPRTTPTRSSPTGRAGSLRRSLRSPTQSTRCRPFRPSPSTQTAPLHRLQRSGDLRSRWFGWLDSNALRWCGYVYSSGNTTGNHTFTINRTVSTGENRRRRPTRSLAMVLRTAPLKTS